MNARVPADPPNVRVTLLCTVRDCRMPLTRDGRSYVCGNSHAFDVSRSGYINLLQPQDRRSRTPGDTSEAVQARRRFLDAGYLTPLVEQIVATLPVASGEAILDVGCGEGHHLAAFRRTYGAESHGLDISVPAIELAARRYRDCHWIVANADRFLPYNDSSFSLITSITARMNPEEFRRVLMTGGRVLVAIPAADDLIEVREAILGEGIERDRVQRTIAEFAPLFVLERHERLQHRAHLDRQAMVDVMSSSYRGLRTRERERLEEVESMDVTISRDVLVFRSRGLNDSSVSDRRVSESQSAGVSLEPQEPACHRESPKPRGRRPGGGA